jgi:PAS domain S-box-containing protein
MKINNRIIIILCVVAGALLVALALISHFLIFSTFAEIEQKQATADMQLILTRLNGEVEGVAATCRNWALSDDTYRFVRGDNPNYIDANLAEPALFRDMGITYVLFYNSAGKLVYFRGYDQNNGTELALPQELDVIIHNSIIPVGVPEGIPGRRGFSMIEGKPIALAGYPIATPTHRDSMAGTLIMVRVLDADQISALVQQTELDISLRPIPHDGDNGSGDVKKMESGAILVAPVNVSVMEGTAYITGIENKPTKFLLVVNTPRALYQQVLAAMMAIGGAIIILAIIMIFTIRWPLKKYIVNPILALDKSMKTIGKSGDISQTVTVVGDDEIRSLADSLNRMLEEIHTAQRQMMESESKFRTLAETSVAGIFVFRQKTLYANPAAELQTGYTREELFQMNFWDFIHPDFQERVRDRWQKRQLGEEVPVRIEFMIIRKDGEERWIDASTTGFTYEGELASFSIRTDITGRKRTEEALRINEEKFRALTENTPDIVFSLDLNNNVTYISPRFEKYGFPTEDVVGKAISGFIFPEDKEQAEKNFRNALAGRYDSSTPFRILDKWQNVHWLEVNSTAILDPAGNCTGLQGMIRDITERRKTLDAITLANKKLNLMYDITRHDILNKITVLLGLIDMTNASASSVEREQFLSEIRTAGTAIHRQIALTRDYQEVGVKAPRWNNMTEVISRSISGFSNSGVFFETDIENLEVYADPLIEKVIYNLVDNAIRYGKKITRVSFSSRISKNGLELICADDGIGIDAFEKEKIFERGFGNNTGLGLFLAREILMITAITIRETGEPGCGAIFVLSLPKGTFRSVEQ